MAYEKEEEEEEVVCDKRARTASQARRSRAPHTIASPPLHQSIIMLAAAAVLLLCGANMMAAPAAARDAQTLREAAAAQVPGLFVGAAVNAGTLTTSGEHAYNDTAAAEFSITTPENRCGSLDCQQQPLSRPAPPPLTFPLISPIHHPSTHNNSMKMCTTQRTRGAFDFTGGDAVVAFARSHGLQVRGHNLVWCAHNPPWLVALAPTLAPAELEAIMVQQINASTAHWRGQLYSWDVVNEAILNVPPPGCHSWRCALMPGPTEAASAAAAGSDARPAAGDLLAGPLQAASCGKVNWTRVDDYIAKAFRLAAAGAPGARLFYNDYLMHDEIPKVDFVVAMLSDLRAAGVPVHGMGIQLHIKDTFNATSLAANMVLSWERGGVGEGRAGDRTGNLTSRCQARFAALGLEIHITEASIAPTSAGIYANITSPDGLLQAQARAYAAMLQVCLEQPACTSFEVGGGRCGHQARADRTPINTSKHHPPDLGLHGQAHVSRHVHNPAWRLLL